MAFALHQLPDRIGDAATNMATDFLLLQRYPSPEALVLRHYQWRRPAFTFGFGQKIAFIRACLPDPSLDLCRRPTGGGLVDHREDWTYSLVIPKAHPLHAERAQVSYRAVHQALAEALVEAGQPAALQERPPEGKGPGICFQQAEVFDVIDPRNGAKIAGAAQKRAKRGMLFQGSIWQPAAALADWEVFAEAFARRLADSLGAPLQTPGWPEMDPDEESGLIDQYASPDWTEGR
jgi:lipoyl(octanoyl) transferase